MEEDESSSVNSDPEAKVRSLFYNVITYLICMSRLHVSWYDFAWL